MVNWHDPTQELWCGRKYPLRRALRRSTDLLAQALLSSSWTCAWDGIGERPACFLSLYAQQRVPAGTSSPPCASTGIVSGVVRSDGLSSYASLRRPQSMTGLSSSQPYFLARYCALISVILGARVVILLQPMSAASCTVRRRACVVAPPSHPQSLWRWTLVRPSLFLIVKLPPLRERMQGIALMAVVWASFLLVIRVCADCPSMRCEALTRTSESRYASTIPGSSSSLVRHCPPPRSVAGSNTSARATQAASGWQKLALPSTVRASVC